VPKDSELKRKEQRTWAGFDKLSLRLLREGQSDLCRAGFDKLSLRLLREGLMDQWTGQQAVRNEPLDPCVGLQWFQGGNQMFE